MNRFKSVCFAVAGLGLAAVSLAGDALSDFKKAMLAMEPRVEKAFANEDIAFFEKITAPDFRIKEMGKVMNKKEAMAQMKQMFASASNIKVDFRSTGFKVQGNIGTLHTDSSMTCEMDMGDGKKHKMAMKQKMLEKYRKTKTGWMVFYIENLPGGTMTMDGKPFDPSKIGGG